MRITNIEQDELEDFENELRLQKRRREEFKLVQHIEHATAAGIAPQRGTVTVLHLRTGVARKYSTDSGNAWVGDFVNDLDAGVF